MKIINGTKGVVLAQEAALADSPFTRLKGLLGKASLPKGQAMVIKPCNSVHTFFMRFSIDVLFLDKQQRVISAAACLKPFRASRIYFKGYSVIELPEGTIKATSTCPGDQIIFA